MIGGLVALALLLGVSDVAAEPATGLPRVGILMCCAPEQPLGANSAALVQGLYVRLGVIAAKVLRGAKPADLPIERPARFDLVVNLKTARALGLTIPPPMLLRATEIVE